MFVAVFFVEDGKNRLPWRETDEIAVRDLEIRPAAVSMRKGLFLAIMSSSSETSISGNNRVQRSHRQCG